MMNPAHGFERDDRIIPVHHQPACLIDFALAREINNHQLLRGTGIFLEQLQEPEKTISPAQWLRLCENTERCLAAEDTSFQIGQRLLPGHYGPVSIALTHAADVLQAMQILCQFPAELSPLLAPRLILDERYIGVYWLDSCGLGKQHRFVVETAVSAVTAMCRWLSGEKLPWRFLFAHDKPDYIEQYHAHLGDDLHFNAHVDAMILPRQFATRAWPRAVASVASKAMHEAEVRRQRQGFQQSFIAVVYDLIWQHRRKGCSLEQLSEHLAISPATCKRKLKLHDNSFQQLHDQMRKHVALYLYWAKGYRSEDVANYLGFHDSTNFRRSFKRWTGQLPSVIRDWLPQFGL